MKKWTLARLREGSTKWGVAVLAVLGVILFNSDQIGEYAHRLTEIGALLAALRLITTQEKVVE